VGLGLGVWGIAAGAAGVLFVTDIYNCALRRVVTQPGCGVTTLGRTGCPMFVNEDTRGILRNPFGVAVGRGPLSVSTSACPMTAREATARAEAAGMATGARVCPCTASTEARSGPSA
jgi:hypothetical protein